LNGDDVIVLAGSFVSAEHVLIDVNTLNSARLHNDDVAGREFTSPHKAAGICGHLWAS
jgi:hypothetical protein